ncbi:MAG: H4MPT-linked C1 transfer pathway protein [Planctomycetota bacterium]|jgi:probable H4MPT-linked C1 transfer pathway protein|nr:H4MPT-linked C1 transfer pathway protein [Planctomycetota bacterium]
MPPVSDLVALDIGGANLKAADGLGWSASVSFPLWQRWRELPAAVTALVADRQPRRIVATMTGEICDCYASRAEGVSHIAESLTAAATALGCLEPPGVYLVDGRLIPASDAAGHWRLAAASNWHVLARLAASLLPTGRGMLLDIGSTTTDIVPLTAGAASPLAHDDAGRMLTGELVYTGLERTPIAAIVRRLPHRGQWRPVASERFAESRDAWLLLGAVEEDAGEVDTADGGPATSAAARVRIARTMLLDPAEFTTADAITAAAWIADRQAAQVARGVRRVFQAIGNRPDAAVISGHGGPLAERALRTVGWHLERHDLTAWLGPGVARAAPAHALARLVRETIR